MKLPRRQISAPGRGCCRTVGRVAERAGASLSDAAYHNDRAIPSGRAGGYSRALYIRARARASLGQPVIIQNVSGAAGSLGVGQVARAAPDGYTLVIGIWSTHVVNAAIYTLQYDVLNDFEPIALLTNNSSLIVAKKTMPAHDLKSLIAWLKANPDKVSAGTAGVGSPQHVFGILFQNATGTRRF